MNDWQQKPLLSSADGEHRRPTTATKILKAPFPYMGAKSKVAGLVWSRLGNVDNYVEPFMGSLAVLLKRPADHFLGGYRVETANDKSHHITNFWRAVRHAPDEVAEWADSPVSECDLHARHRWLMRSEAAATFRQKMTEDPDHYDAKVAGWWCWGLCCWIGSGWCEERGVDWKQVPDFDADRGENSTTGGRPQLADAYDIGRGVNSGGGLSVQKPDLTQDRDIGRGVLGSGVIGTCDARRAWLVDWMRRLSDRLRLVRTCYGHWSRICDSDSTITRLGVTGVFLDPPYPTKTKSGTRADGLYATDNGQDLDALRDEVLAWCVKWGAVQDTRVAVCGYEGDGYEALVAEHGWTCESWEASGGYGNQTKGKKGKAANAKRERIWFSPQCLTDTQPDLFAGME